MKSMTNYRMGKVAMCPGANGALGLKNYYYNYSFINCKVFLFVNIECNCAKCRMVMKLYLMFCKLAD